MAQEQRIADGKARLEERSSRNNESPGGASGSRSLRPQGEQSTARKVNSPKPYSPLPSASTMPLSLQQLSGSAASSTDSLGSNPGPRNTASPVQPRGPRAYHYTQLQTSGQAASRRLDTAMHVTPQSTIQPGSHEASVTGGRPTLAPAVHISSPAVTQHRTLPSAPFQSSPYQTSPQKSSSSVNSLATSPSPASSATVFLGPRGDVKGKAKADSASEGAKAAVPKAGTRVTSEIEEAVRNLGLAPPPSRPPILEQHSYSNGFGAPWGSPHGLSVRPSEPLSRGLSERTDASANDAASLSGTLASSSASLSQDQQSISMKSTKSAKSSKKSVKSTKESTTSKTKKSKKTGNNESQGRITESNSAMPSSTARNASSAASIHSASAPKTKKKKAALPTSSGRPAGSVPSTLPLPERARSPNVNHNVQNAVAAGPNAGHQSRNRHLDESAVLRTVPQAPVARSNPPQLQSQRRANDNSVDPRVQTAPATSTPAGQRSEARPPSLRVDSPPGSLNAAVMHTSPDTNEPPPPPWAPPLTTITLQYTPIHAYLADYHDPVDAPNEGRRPAAAQSLVREPNSPPPPFRSRTPSPVAGPLSRPAPRRTSSGSILSMHSCSDLDLEAVEERSRGYSSSEDVHDLATDSRVSLGAAQQPLSGPSIAMSAGTEWQYINARKRMRQWEAWRREGLSLEERVHRLQSQGVQSALSTMASARENGEQVSRPPHEFSAASEPASMPFESASRSSELSENSTAVLSPQPVRNVLSSGNELAPPRQHSPGRSDLSQQSSGQVSSPRFPSVGTIRRARLKRFEAQRQSSKKMSTVIEPSPPTSSVTPDRLSVSKLVRSAGVSNQLDQVESAHTHGRVPASTIAGTRDRQTAESQSDVNNASVSLLDPQLGGDEQLAPASGNEAIANGRRSSDARGYQRHQLARQLAAEVNAKQRQQQTDVGRIIIGETASPRPSGSGTGPGEVAEQQDAPTSSPMPSEDISEQDEANQSAPRRASSRISRLLRPNMGPRALRSGPAVQADPAPNAIGTERPHNTEEPTMTLPRAPPRLTTDPLSTNNLRRLSKKQERSPVAHSSRSADSSSNSSVSSDDEGTAETSSANKLHSESDSDSADDTSTKKPMSSMSIPSALTALSAASPTVIGESGDREAVAASWRRTQDGRRHSALLSRPLSIKRKPPPLPPKRWGGIWDPQSLPDRLKNSLNFLSDPESPGSQPAGSSSSTVPASSRPILAQALPTVDEADNTWEVTGRTDPPPLPAADEIQWQVVGREDEAGSEQEDSSQSRYPSGPGQETRNSFPDNHRRPPPPPPRFSASGSAYRTDISSSEMPRATASGASLQRTPATRRPQSMMLARRSSSQDSIPNSSLPLPSPPSPEIRTQLNKRPRHVYSSSVPNALARSSAFGTASQQRMPPISSFRGGSDDTRQPQQAPLHMPPAVSETVEAARLPTPNLVDAQEYTDLEVMLSSLDENTPVASARVLQEVLGFSHGASAAEIDSLPVGRVELERRRVDKKGKIKQKLACVGINCNKCKICLQQFKEDELAVVLPICLEVFHAEPCMRAHLASNNRCPSCKAALM